MGNKIDTKTSKELLGKMFDCMDADHNGKLTQKEARAKLCMDDMMVLDPMNTAMSKLSGDTLAEIIDSIIFILF